MFSWVSRSTVQFTALRKIFWLPAFAIRVLPIKSPVVARELGGIINAVERPNAPSLIASATRFFIVCNSAALGRVNEVPITHSHTVPSPT